MTCFTGFFHHPQYPTLDESLLRYGNGGAIAIWAGTGLGVGTGHTALQRGFYRALMQQGQTRLGVAALAGKVELYKAGYYQDLLDTYSLLGDPALNLAAVLKPDLQLSQQLIPQDPTPGQAISLVLTVKNSGVGSAQTISLTDNLPAGLLSPVWSASRSGVSLSGGAFQWQLPDLEPGHSLVITIATSLDPVLPATFALFNTASVSSASPELSLGNNSSTLIIGGKRVYLPLVRRSN
jgi:uncharacterized repeat protein (TIGR01451 family)